MLKLCVLVIVVTVMCCLTLSAFFQMCPRGHTVWKWASQPILKYGMLAGDFMLSSNILLSGNNYAKISLLLKFMNMGMVERSTFFRIQDSYCVDTIKEFWDEKRASVITQLKSKGPVVALGEFDKHIHTYKHTCLLHNMHHSI